MKLPSPRHEKFAPPPIRGREHLNKNGPGERLVNFAGTNVYAAHPTEFRPRRGNDFNTPPNGNHCRIIIGLLVGDPGGFIASVVGAIILLVLYRLVVKKPTSRRGHRHVPPKPDQESAERPRPRKGYIGFAGHSDPVEFRSFKVKLSLTSHMPFERMHFVGNFMKLPLLNLLAVAALAARCTAAEPPSKKPAAIELGSRRELLVDDFLIERVTGAALTMHQPESREVALLCDGPWEGNTSAYYTLLEDDGLFRMYYRGGARGRRSRGHSPRAYLRR